MSKLKQNIARSLNGSSDGNLADCAQVCFRFKGADCGDPRHPEGHLLTD